MQTVFGMDFRKMMDQTFKNGPLFELVETFRVLGIDIAYSGLLLNKLKEKGFKKYVKNLSLQTRSAILDDLRTVGLHINYFGIPPSQFKENLIDADMIIIRKIWIKHVPEIDTDIVDRGLRELKAVLMAI